MAFRDTFQFFFFFFPLSQERHECIANYQVLHLSCWGLGLATAETIIKKKEKEKEKNFTCFGF